MASREQKKHQKAQKRKQKKKLSQKTSQILANKDPVSIFAKYPIHECIIPEDLFVKGVGTVLISRRSPRGEIGVAAFIVDVFCLGVKNSLFNTSEPVDYESVFKPSLLGDNEGNMNTADPACVKKLLEDVVEYALDLGFKPDPEYMKFKGFLRGIDKTECSETFTFGKEGKPYYINGPYETVDESLKIVKQLERSCGEGNFEYLLGMGDLPEELLNDSVNPEPK